MRIYTKWTDNDLLELTFKIDLTSFKGRRKSIIISQQYLLRGEAEQLLACLQKRLPKE